MLGRTRFVTVIVELNIFGSLGIGCFKLITDAAYFTIIINFRLITGIGVFGRNFLSVCISECNLVSAD